MAVYALSWMALVILAAWIFALRRREMEIASARYWRFLLRPWKLCTFVAAAAAITLIAPHSGDPTWDTCDSILISTLVFAIAPWTIGALHRHAVRHFHPAPAYVALCAAMFSCSWFYDLYILLRDGSYPPTWFWNIPVSGSIYIAAGLLWNLDWSSARGVHLAFLEEGWPRGSAAPFRRVLWIALALMLIAAGITFLALRGLRPDLLG